MGLVASVYARTAKCRPTPTDALKVTTGSMSDQPRDVRMWPEAAVDGGLLFRRCQGVSRHLANGPRPPLLTQPVWKLKIPKLDEKDLLVFDLEIEWACKASTSKGV